MGVAARQPGTVMLPWPAGKVTEAHMTLNLIHAKSSWGPAVWQDEMLAE
jgi:hypothetical protein